MFGFSKKKKAAGPGAQKDRQPLPPSSGLKHSLLSLEQRLMFDAAAAATASEVASEQVAQEQAEAAVSSHSDAEGPTAGQRDSQQLMEAITTYNPGESRTEVVFVDPTVPNYQALLNGMDSYVEVIMLDGGQDGVEQMAEALSGRTGIDAIHVISHGGAGELQLGTGVLNADSMSEQYADELATIQQSLSEQADILVYGCEFAQGEAGQAAVDMLAELTGADVQASTDLTGSISLGGDWEFEVSTGAIETSLAVSYDAQMNWADVLATETVKDTFSSTSYSNNNGTQSWSTSWSETDAGGSGASGGDVRVNSGQLRIDTDTVGNAISRGVDLSRATSATLTFNYTNSLSGADRLELRVSTDGGTTYRTLSSGVFSNSTNTGSGTASFDLSGYMSANTKIQFIVTGTGGGDRLYVDNVQVSYETGPTNNAPTISNLSGDRLSYSEGAGAVVVDQGGNALVVDADSANFDTGTLTVSIPVGAEPTEDVLSIRNQGTGTGEIGVSGNTVTYGGVNIGTVTGGAGGNNLVVSFNGNATPTAVTALLKNVTYEDINTNSPAEGSFTIRFALTDGDGGTSANYDVSAYVSGVNDAPTDLSLSANTVAENATTGTVVGTVSGTDPDANDTKTYSFTDNAGGRFAINSSTGVITVANGSLLNYENATSHTVIVKVTDSGGLTYSETFTINLTDVNESVPVITSNGGGATTAVTVSENTTVVTTVTATDTDTRQTLTYSIAGGADAAKFTINSATGALSFVSAPNYESPTDSGGNNVYDVTVQVSDGKGGTATQAIAVTVTSVNEAPTDLSLSANTVAENAANGTVVGTVSGTDPDSGDTKTYSFTDSAGGRFAINSSTGQITVANSSLLNYESATSHTVAVRVTDSGGLTYDETFTINLTNVNEPPTDLSLSANTVAENAPNGTVVGTVSGTDPDSGDTKTYSFTDSADGRFAINSSTGQITVANSSLLNYESATSHTVTVRVTDSGGLTYDETFTINLTNVNEAPTGSDTTVMITEDTSHTLTTANFGFSDVDAGDSLNAVRIDTIPTAGTLTLSGVAVTAGQVVSVADITGGHLVFTPATDANGTGYTGFSFSVRDSNNAYDAAPNTLTFDVTTVNDAPVNVVPGAQTVAVDIPLTISGLSITDVDGNLTTVQLSVTNGTLDVTLNGAAIITSGGIGTSTVTLSGTQADINATLGSLSYQGNSLFTGTDTLTVRSTDGNGATDTDTVAITVLNNAPTNVLPGPQTVTEDTPLAISGLSVTDADGNLTSVQLSVSHGTLALTLSGGAMISAGSTGSGSVTVSGTQADLNATLASLIYQGQSNYTGADTLTITSIDSTGTSDTDSVSITVTPVNDAPTDLTLSNNSVVEHATNGTTVGMLNPSDADAGDTFTYQLTDNVGGRFAVNATTGQITVADGSLLHSEVVSSHDVTIRVTDSGGLTYDKTFTINLTDINEAPSDLTLSGNTIVENATNGSVVGTVSGTDLDTGDSLTYSFTDSAGGRFAINSSTGQITVADGSLLNYESATSHSVTVRVTDSGGLTYDETFTINLTNVNETPTDLAPSTNSVVEHATNGTTVGTVTPIDPDSGDTFTYQLIDTAGGRFAIDSATGQITVANSTLLDYESATSHSVTVRVTDSGGVTYDETFTINLTNVNEGPTDLSLSAQTVLENASTGTVVGTVTGTDPDAGDTKTYSLTDTAGGRFAIDSATGQLTVANGSLLNYESATSHTVTVQVTDSAGLTYTETFTIHLINVNEGPIQVQAGNGEEGSIVASLHSNASEIFGDHNMAAFSSTIVDANRESDLQVLENLRKPVEWNSQHNTPVDILDSGRNVSKVAPDGDGNQMAGPGRNENFSSSSSKQSEITEDHDRANATRPESAQVPWSPREETEHVSDDAGGLSMPIVAGLVGTALQGSLGTKEKLTAMRTRIRGMSRKSEDEKKSQPQGADDKEVPPGAA